MLSDPLYLCFGPSDKSARVSAGQFDGIAEDYAFASHRDSLSSYLMAVWRAGPDGQLRSTYIHR